MRRASLVRGSILIGLLATLAGAPLRAQQEVPAEWRWKLDRPATVVTSQEIPDSGWRFVQMPPGWHVTTGPGVLLYHPDASSAGRFSLSTDIVLFPDPGEAGFGLFFGGKNLDSGTPSYLTVLLSRAGTVSVRSRAGGVETVLAPWTVHAAIKPHPGTGIVSNKLRVAVGSDSLRVFVNDSAVIAVGRSGLSADGVFGLRIGEQINMHVTTLDYTRHLAPARPIE